MSKPMDPRLSALSALSAPAETTRLFMRIPHLSDRTALYRTVRASHDSLSRFLSWCTPDYAPSDTEQWLQGAAQEALTGKGFHYLLFERVSGDLVGCCGLSDPDPSGTWNLGYWVRKQSEGRGYASEAVNAVLDRAKRSRVIRKAEIRMLLANDASQRVAIKSGATYEGVRDQAIHLDGQRWPALIYAHEFNS